MKREVLRAVRLVSDHAGRRRLDHVSLLLTQADALGVIGRSGAGKGSLAAVLTGQAAPDAGTVLLRERPADRKALLAAGLRIDRGSRLMRGLSVTENLMLSFHTGGLFWRGRKLQTLCWELLQSYDLAQFLNTPTALSPVCVQHCLLLVRAVLQGKQFVVLNSVAEHYTTAEQLMLLQTIHAVCGRGLAVLYASQRMDAVQRGLARCAVMAEGRVVKLLCPAQCDAVTLRAYAYGFEPPPALAGAPAKRGVALFSLHGFTICAGTHCVVRDADGTAGALASHVRLACKKAGLPAPAVLNDDVLDNGLVRSMTVLDNIMLTAARKTAGAGWHISRRMQRLIRQECAAHTGLTDAQQLLQPDLLSRRERLALLLYRFSLLGARVYFIHCPAMDEGERAALSEAVQRLLSAGCVVISAENDASMPLQAGARCFVWENAVLREDA